MDKLKIKRNLIGSKVFCATINQYVLIEPGNEERYAKLGLDVFTKRRTPKLQKNVKNTKKRNNNDSSNSNGTNNDSES